MEEQANLLEPVHDETLVRRPPASLRDRQALGEMASAIGGEVEVDFEVSAAAPEQEGTPRYATIADFYAVAKAHDRAKQVATRAWDILQRAFFAAHHSGEAPPITFATYPEIEGQWPYDAVINDLDIASLAQTTSQLRASIEGKGERKVESMINAVLGRNASIGILGFLELVVASWPPQSEESQ